MANIFAYMRISTKAKDDKQSFNRQEKSILKYAKENNLEIHSIFKDDKTGSTFDRKEFKKLDSILKKGDTIIFKEISRFTRETENGYKKYMEFLERGINLIFLDNPTVNTDYIKKLGLIAEKQEIVTKTALEGTIKLLLIVELDRVEKERENLIKRIKQGIESSEKKSGRKKGQIIKMSEELEKDIKNYFLDRAITKTELAKRHNITRVTLDKYIKKFLKNNNRKGYLCCKMD